MSAIQTLKTDAFKGEALGFIYSQTSHKPTQPNTDSFVIDRHKSRLKRLKHSTITAARLLQEDVDTDKRYRYTARFVTYTYAEGVKWSPKHIAVTLNYYRSWFKSRGVKFRYCWVAEIQEKRKAKFGGHCVHYHVVFWLPRHLQLPMGDKRGWWSHGTTKTELARNPVGYLAKYASKGGLSTDFPKNCRMHGSGGLTVNSRWLKAWWLMPKYVREHFSVYTDRPARAKGGGFVSKVTGDFLQSRYEIISFSPLIIKAKVYQ